AVSEAALVTDDPAGRRSLATGYVPPGLRGYSPEEMVSRGDEGRARELLEAAGYPGGEGLGVIPIWLSTFGPHEERLVADFRRLGVRLRPKLVHWIELGRAPVDGRAPMFLAGENAGAPAGAADRK